MHHPRFGLESAHTTSRRAYKYLTEINLATIGRAVFQRCDKVPPAKRPCDVLKLGQYRPATDTPAGRGASRSGDMLVVCSLPGVRSGVRSWRNPIATFPACRSTPR